ncbi:MAG: tol-pal system protein YbgF [Acidobacteriota bacterium]
MLSLGQDRSKKAYELIYEDIQVIKKQLILLEEKLNRNAAEIESLKAQVREIQALAKSLQASQTGIQEGMKNIPSQYQFLLDKIDQVNLVLNRVSEDLLTIKGSAQPSAAPPQEAKSSQAAPVGKKTPEQKKEPAPTGQKPPPSPLSTLSPQEVYNTAYADYLKGSFELAIDGFKIYRESFPDSPLADNALYWIAECYYSQRKFGEAINQFNDLILNYPQGDKIAAAYLKKGLALIELGRKDEALVVFKLLVSKYPLEEEAKLAHEKIRELAAK